MRSGDQQGLTMNPAVRKFRANRDGRDFVVGDVHGEFPRLQDHLASLNFDPRSDRLFSVGDLVDRGAEPEQALEWLAHPWFHPVLGNHEAMLIDARLSRNQLHWWLLTNGGEWWLSLDEGTRERFRSTLCELPIACEVALTEGRAGIVHADVPTGLDWDEFIRRLHNDDEVRRDALWSRTRVHAEHDAAPVEGVTRVYCGHTPVATPRRIGNVHFIDTGACFGGPLTVLRIDNGGSHSP